MDIFLLQGLLHLGAHCFGEGGVDRVYFTELCFGGVWVEFFVFIVNVCVTCSLWKLWEL